MLPGGSRAIGMNDPELDSWLAQILQEWGLIEAIPYQDILTALPRVVALYVNMALPPY